ncbi:protein Lines homolog 1 [Sorex fumeus]|uniref:protein Lines homolog 1 n=1 Tax=Sorex fumeus TaxID=62283 RepID=UPI0024AD445B|nr:protein Lines homolog 1 [Sorex fumeus]
MEASSDVLDHLYRKVLRGAQLENKSRDYVSYLSPLVSCEGCLASPSRCGPGGQDPAQPASPATPLNLRGPSLKASTHERMLLQLTVIQVMVTRVLSAETAPSCKEKYREILYILLKSSEVDLQLTSLFLIRDKLLSHLAAKCLGLLLYFQLREKVPLSDSWVVFCRTSLGEPLASGQVACCLWVLSAVIKEILKDPGAQKTESLQRFLAPLDAVLEDFYDPFFAQCLGNLRDHPEGIAALLALLDLLELLAASRPHLQPPHPCQRLLFQKAARMLDVVLWPVPAFVRRKSILALKKCLLGKVGEDLSSGPLPAPLPPDPHLEMDKTALADVVLQAVDSGLLRTLSVPGQAPHFGGEEIQPGTDLVPGTDQVMLRAVSLLLIKSLEVRFQRCATAIEGKDDLQRFMAQLLSFLKPHLQPALQCDHPCMWLSQVFIEQDDDMLEAAKASLGIYLQLTRAGDTAGKDGHRGKAAWTFDMHSSGCDPHCIFLSVLGSVSFDPTTLLDFLISSETCFLEYFVWYLKLLRTDWAHFITVCTCWDGMMLEVAVTDDGHVPPVARERHHPGDPGPGAARGGQGDRGAQLAQAPRPILSPPCGAPSLVAYDSSDDSEGEMPGQHLSPVEPRAKPETQETGRVGEGCSWEPPSRPVDPKDPARCFSAAPDAATAGSASARGLCYRTLNCLGYLRQAVVRLQGRGLFPYNPAALLKLLRHIETVYSQRGILCESAEYETGRSQRH